MTPDYTTQQYIPGETTDKGIRRGVKRSQYASGTALSKDLLTPDYTTQQYIPKEYETQDITSNQLTIDGQITNKMIAKDDNIYDINRLLQRIPTSEQNIITGAPTGLTSTFNQVYEERASSFNVEGPKPVVPTMTKPTFGQETTSDNLLYPGVGKIGIKDNKYYEKYGFSSPVSLTVPKKIKETEFELQPRPTMDLTNIPIQSKQDSFSIDIFKKQGPTFEKKEYETTHFEDYLKNQFPTTKKVYPATTSEYSTKKVEITSKSNEFPKVEIKKKIEIPLNRVEPPLKKVEIPLKKVEAPLKKVEIPLKKVGIPSGAKKYVSTTSEIHMRKKEFPQARKSFQVKKDLFPKTVKNRIEKSNTMTHKNKFLTDQKSILSKTKITSYDDDRINKLEGYTNSLKSEHEVIQDTLNILSREIELYKKQIGILEKIRAENEVNALREENEAIKQQIAELNNLRSSSDEAYALRSQLGGLNTIDEDDEDIKILRKQIRELNELKRKVAELNGFKDQLGELNQLREQINQMNNLEKHLQDLNSLKMELADTENIRKTIQEMETNRAQYEQEIENLRYSQKLELLKKRLSGAGYKSRQTLLKERTEHIVVKGGILKTMKELEMLTRKINKSNKKITLNLLYKATIDSDKAEAFHERCDSAKSTLVLIETDKGKRFGGFTTCSWSGDCIEKDDEDAFIFSLDKMKIYENIPGEEAIGCYPKFGPIFLGCQIRIFDNAFTEGGTTFEKGLNFDTEEDYELNDGERVYGVKEIEVYEVIAQ